MDQRLLDKLAAAPNGHPVNSPLDDAAVRELLAHTVTRGDERVLDLGCGQGAWLHRLLAAHPGVRAEGVDTGTDLLALAGAAAEASGCADRLLLHEHDAASFTAPHTFDAVLSVGATHAFGGLTAAIDAAAAHLAPGGRLLIGDAYWEGEPGAEARQLLGEHEDLAGTLDLVTARGWTPVFGHLSTRRELDDFEWRHTGRIASWALDHPADPDGAQALRRATEHRSQWVRGYRDSFGFVTLVLRRTPA